MVDDIPSVGDVLPEGVVVDVQVIEGHTLVTTQSDAPAEEFS